MTDTKDTDKPARRPLTLGRKTDTGTVKQSFSHGRSKQVLVETKKKRVVVAPGAAPKVARPPAAKKQEEAAPLAAAKQAAQKLGLSEAELKLRQAALAQRQKDETKRRAEVEAQEEADRRRLDEAKRIEEDERRRQEANLKASAETNAAERARARPGGATAGPAGAPAARGRPGAERGAPVRGRPAPLEPDVPLEPLAELGGRIKRQKSNDDGPGDARTPARPRTEPKRRQGKLSVSRALNDDDDRQRSYAAVQRARLREQARRKALAGGQSEKVVREVKLPETITVADLANRMTERVADVVKYMMQQGELVRATDTLDADTAELIIEEFGHTVRRVSESDVEIGLEGIDDDVSTLEPRPPIVTVMGHVDHGKTSLLDALRSTDVVSGEAGGITQHIGAYQVQLSTGDRITFLDTPGHAAFSAMRARGADVTDIVILVVAADDGVMPQTIEAIQHAKAAKVPLIVAVNKIDVEGADPNKVLTQLLQYDVQVTAMGGEVEAVQVSALKKIGLEALTETITLQAELLELKANPNREADGVVVESQLDKGRGAVATVLMRRGTLRRGEIVVAGSQWGKVKAIMNERGQALDEAGPAAAVEILGLDGTPDPGDPFVVVATESRAREITDYRQRTKRNLASAAPGSRASLEQLLSRLKEGGAASTATQEAPLIVKGDVQGSVEAITQALEKLSTDEVRARVVLGAAGGISESDVQLAITAGTPIIAFNVRANKQARDLAEAEGVEIRYYSVIYDLLNDVKATLSGMLAPEKRETFLGYAEILQVFNISKVGKVAGCRVSEGIVRRGSGVRLLRENVVIHEGELSTLKRFKDEVQEVKQGMECGMGFANYNDIREGDQIECFQVDMIERSLD